MFTVCNEVNALNLIFKLKTARENKNVASYGLMFIILIVSILCNIYLFLRPM